MVVEVFGGGLGGRFCSGLGGGLGGGLINVGSLGLDSALGVGLYLGGGDGSCVACGLRDDMVSGQQCRTHLWRSRG